MRLGGKGRVVRRDLVLFCGCPYNKSSVIVGVYIMAPDFGKLPFDFGSEIDYLEFLLGPLVYGTSHLQNYGLPGFP